MPKYWGLGLACISLEGHRTTHNTVPHSSHVLPAHVDSISAHHKCTLQTLQLSPFLFLICAQPLFLLPNSLSTQNSQLVPDFHTYCTYTLLLHQLPISLKKIEGNQKRAGLRSLPPPSLPPLHPCPPASVLNSAYPCPPVHWAYLLSPTQGHAPAGFLPRFCTITVSLCPKPRVSNQTPPPHT